MRVRTKPSASAKQALAPEDPRQYLNCLIGVPPESRARWAELLRLSRAALAEGPNARSERLAGRALSFLGEPDEALAAFDRALAAEPRHREGLTWRGEARLLKGELDAAEKDLSEAIRLDPRWPWARLLRAVCRLSRGELDAAQKDLQQASRARAAAPTAAALDALLEGQRGRPQRGLDRLARARPTALSCAVRGLLRRDLGDLDGSRGEFDRAIALEPSAWAYSQRADVLNRTGFFQKAVEDARRAGELLPNSPLPRAQEANIFFDQAMYVEAMEALERALALAPDDASLRARRARFLLVLSRFVEAESDMARACALAPDDGQLRFERLLVQILLGREDEALAALSAARLDRAFSDYLRGYVACRRRDYVRARVLFLSAAKAADGGFAERLRFYALVARLLAETSVARTAGDVEPRLYLCGIGIRHPYQISVEALRALARCAVLYNNLGDPQVTEFLGLFGAEIRAVTRVPGEPAMGRVERLIAGLDSGRPSGFVTRIHPYIYRRIANDLVTVCRREGLSFHAFGAVSLTEVSWGLGEAARASGPSDPSASRVFDIYELTRKPGLLEPRAATVVYCIAAGEVRRALCRLLRDRYSAGHVVYILAGSGDKEREVEPVRVRELESRLLAVDLGAVLYIPAEAGEDSPWKR